MGTTQGFFLEGVGRKVHMQDDDLPRDPRGEIYTRVFGCSTKVHHWYSACTQTIHRSTTDGNSRPTSTRIWSLGEKCSWPLWRTTGAIISILAKRMFHQATVQANLASPHFVLVGQPTRTPRSTHSYWPPMIPRTKHMDNPTEHTFLLPDCQDLSIHGPPKAQVLFSSLVVRIGIIRTYW